jgi:hypothetical protein
MSRSSFPYGMPSIKYDKLLTKRIRADWSEKEEQSD